MSTLPARVLPPEMQEMIELTRELAPQIVTVQSQTGVFDFGDKDLKPTIAGIVLGDVRPRAYWEKSLDEGGEGIPDCSSPDGRKPVAREGGTVQNPTCFGCPQDAWGSDPKGTNGKACKQKAIVIVLEPDAITPIALRLPATSIRAMDTYYQKLLSKSQGFSSVVTQFTLEMRKNAKGISYASLVASKVRDVNETEAGLVDAIRPYVPKFKQMLSGAKPIASVDAPGDAIDSEEVPY